MNIIKGGSVTSPKGFKAAGVACGLKKNGNRDLALVVSDVTANAAGVFTKNVVKGHSLVLSMKNISNGRVSAIAINSGNANACLGEVGVQNANDFANAVAKAVNVPANDILVYSTGVIGMPLDIDAIKSGVADCASTLSYEGGTLAAEAIMTTDTQKKEIAIEFEVTDGKTITVGGMCKGSGMIHPNMATMIGVVTTDANIPADLLQETLSSVVEHTFNRTSVDGDTSVCDCVTLLANGCSDSAELTRDSEDYAKFVEAFDHICTYLARNIAKDGEGASKLLEIKTVNANSAETAYQTALAVAKSPLVKTAAFGEDANWGRILTAVGYSGAEFNPDKVDIWIGDVLTCKDGVAVAFDEDEALKELKKDEITFVIDFKDGEYCDRMFTCDFTYDYVRINGDYRT